MNSYLLLNSPLIILCIGLILAIPDRKKLQKGYLSTLISLILAFCANTLNLVFILTDNSLILNENNLSVSSSPLTYWIAEMFLFVEILFYITGKNPMQVFHSQSQFNFIFLMFAIGILGMISTLNLAILGMFLLWTQVCIYYLFFFGTYKKNLNTIRMYKQIMIISTIILFSTLGFLYFIAGTLNILSLIVLYTTFSQTSQIIIFLGIILGVGLNCGFFPILNGHLKQYYLESNFMNLWLYSTIFVPALAFISLRLFSIFSFSQSNLYIIGVLLAAVSGVYFLLNIIYQVFKKNVHEKRWIYLLFGNFSSLEYFVYLLIGLHLIPINLDIIMLKNTLIFNLFLISIIGKALIYETLTPIFPLFDNFYLKNVSRLFKTNTFHAIFLCILPLFFFSPYLSGYQLIQELLILFLEDFPQISVFSWLSFGIIGGFFIALLLIIGKIITECLIGTSKNDEKIKVEMHSSMTYLTPIILLGSFIILFIFVP
ncbi:hypothetical protein NEF87_004643 [Candidatus Lokiarchaeum ossiferum]|uniref:NADH:quinone oxidoreductase/Mrp antiporter membrane subunit domain-containing protein n=1 Tax=Candidatus Lokiarchaeum ossiferum TaxID=2951803 RepID=A0ABY6HXV3_9ARCH|nr:hypothetical protein NEF87_004643 [Candidatus Lokiarchaeum sp. B-35]